MKKLVLATLAFAPALAFAQEPRFSDEVTVVGSSGPTDFKGLIDMFLSLIEVAIPLVVSLALLVFIWGLVKFISRVGGDEKAVTDGKNLMIWGLIAIFIMVSLWGILRFFYGDLGFARQFGFPLLPQ